MLVRPVEIKLDEIEVQSYSYSHPPIPDVDDFVEAKTRDSSEPIVYFDSKKHHYVLLVGKKIFDGYRHHPTEDRKTSGEISCIVRGKPKTDAEKFALYLTDKIYPSTQTMDTSMIRAVNALRWTEKNDVSVNEVLELALEYDKGYGIDYRRIHKRRNIKYD